MKSIVKYILIAIAVVIIIIVAYVVLAERGGTPTNNTGSSLVSESGNIPSLPVQSTSEVEEFSNELLVLLTSLESITLNDSIFFNPAFNVLRDISIPLLREGNEGRPNPFAPIGFTDPLGGTTFGSSQNIFSNGLEVDETETSGPDLGADATTSSDTRETVGQDFFNNFGSN